MEGSSSLDVTSLPGLVAIVNVVVENQVSTLPSLVAIGLVVVVIQQLKSFT